MNFKKAFKKLQESKEFKNWKKEKPKAYLVHFFIQLDPDYNRSDWEIGFYDKEKDKITSFIIKERIEIKPEEEVFKKEKHEVKKLKIEQVEVDLDSAVKIFEQLQEKKYPGQWPMKIFAILQNIDCGLVWNITSATRAFSALNVKISAVNSKVVEDKCNSFFDFRVKD